MNFRAPLLLWGRLSHTLWSDNCHDKSVCSRSEGGDAREPSLLYCDWFGTNKAFSKWRPDKMITNHYKARRSMHSIHNTNALILEREQIQVMVISLHATPPVPICRSFWHFKIHKFCYASKYIFMSRYILLTMNLDLPKRPTIWNGGSTQLAGLLNYSTNHRTIFYMACKSATVIGKSCYFPYIILPPFSNK
jgi:hypothetical protein